MLKAEIQKILLYNNNVSREILCNINFNISEKKIYTILGKNGSGKSTLIKSLTRLLNDTVYKVDGNVFWNEENIYKMGRDRLLEIRRKSIKYVLQDLTNNFDPLKKLKYYFDNSGINKQVIFNQLNNFLLPDYKTISELHTYEISGGMAQRISLMLAILSNPKLLILDEPTSAIDYAIINLIKLKLLDFKQNGGSALIVTQDINFAKEISDEVAFLHENKLSEFINSQEFFDNSEQRPYDNFLKSFKEIQ
ncbi:MAG TPA: hypothetical protein DHV28_00035 [Ignavibacteriales bacterium]|nr:hypothetical protein [Ignavibacteriales bacterium]